MASSYILRKSEDFLIENPVPKGLYYVDIGHREGTPRQMWMYKNGIMHIKRLPLMAQWTTHSKVFGSDLGWTGRYEATPRRRVSIFKLHAHQSVPKSILRALSKQFPRVDEFYVFT